PHRPSPATACSSARSRSFIVSGGAIELAVSIEAVALHCHSVEGHGRLGRNFHEQGVATVPFPAKIKRLGDFAPLAEVARSLHFIDGAWKDAPDEVNVSRKWFRDGSRREPDLVKPSAGRHVICYRLAYEWNQSARCAGMR